jgi:hypothetical protein
MPFMGGYVMKGLKAKRSCSFEMSPVEGCSGMCGWKGFQAYRLKALALNRAFSKYFRLVK